MMHLTAIRQAYLSCAVHCAKSDSTKDMMDDIYMTAISKIQEELYLVLDWLLETAGQALPCKCWEIPLGTWATVIWAIQQGVESYVDRSKYRDKILYPLRIELAKFSVFYVKAEQMIERDLPCGEAPF